MTNNIASSKKSIGIIGFGRFGQVLANLLYPDFEIKVHDLKLKENINVTFCDLKTILQEKILFIAVPIRCFENIIKKIANKISSGTTIIDVCSVKVYPVKIMKIHLKNDVEIIATHPLFGPDSVQQSKNLKIMMNNVSAKEEAYCTWKTFFESKNINVIEMTPEEHDNQAAVSQCVTHFIGRVLQATNIKNVDISTLSFQQLLNVKNQTCEDTWELFEDLQQYNPYSREALASLEKAFEETLKKL